VSRFPPQQRFTTLENHEPATKPPEFGEGVQSLLPADVRTGLMGTAVIRAAGTMEITAIGQLETGKQRDLTAQHDSLETVG
jgi:hypothetical protein